MKKYLSSFSFICLFFLSGCATKYLVPGNRFLTPESQGEAFRGQIEFQQTNGNQVTINTANGTVDDGVTYSETPRSGFLFSNSVFDKFDIVWSHMGAASSMMGVKFQFIGPSRVSKGTGHKVSLAALFGGNEHETDDESIEFELTGREYLLLYGYRINENILPYASLSLATYAFNGEIKSSPQPEIVGLKPEFVTTSRSVNGGVELSFDAFFTKLEATYQQLETTDTKSKERFVFGYSLGFNW